MARSLRLGPVVVTTALLLCAVAAAFGWLASRVVTAGMELMAAESSGRALFAAVDSGDVPAAAAAAREAGDHAKAAAAATADPLWAVAEAMPALGDDFYAVRALSTHAATVTDRVLDPLVSLVGSGAAASASPAQLAAVGGALDDAGEAVADSTAAVAAIDTATLLPPLREATEAVGTALAGVSPAVDALAALAAFAGTIDGEGHTVLVMLQNPAELRTGGGITGSFVLLRAEGGRFELVEQADSSQFAQRDVSIVPLPDSGTALYGDVVGRFVQNASMPTDFATTAALATAWWAGRGGPEPDAVVSLDPLALRGVLAATGALALPDGSQLSADNLAQRVLVDPYLQYDSEAQTAFLQSVTAALFERLTTLEADVLTWGRALAAPVAEGRIALWSADTDVQRSIDGTVLAGPAGRIAAAGPDTFAVFLNDATGGKMDTFLHVDIQLSAAQCRADGRADILVRLTMRSSAPDPGTLTPDMTGNGLWGTAIGDIGTSVSVAAPPGSYFGGVTKDGERELSVDVVDAGRPTSLVRINLSPDEVNVVEFRFVSADAGPMEPTLIHTPLVNAPEVVVDRDLECG